MTSNDKLKMQERKRAGMRRRLQQVREAHDLPKLTNRERERLLDMVMAVRGDAPVDSDLRVLHKLATRGLVE